MWDMKLQEVQMIEVLTSVNSEITNLDDAFFNKVIFGNQSGILPEKLNNCAIFLSSPNQITIDTGELLIYGVRVRITEPIAFTFTSIPNERIDYMLIAEIELFEDKSIECNFFYKPVGEITKDNIYQKGRGVYQILLAKFAHLATGEISNLNKILEAIKNGNSGVNVGKITTTTVPVNSLARVSIESKFNESKLLEELNFDFCIPQGAVGQAGTDGMSGWITISDITTKIETQVVTVLSSHGRRPNVNDWVISKSAATLGNVGIVTSNNIGANVNVKFAFSLRGQKGDSFTYDDFTPKQLEDLKGLPGRSIEFRGEWSNSEKYNITDSFQDAVHYSEFIGAPLNEWRNGTFVCVKNNTGCRPNIYGNNEYWRLLCSARQIPGPQGEQGKQGKIGPANKLTIGTVMKGAEAAAEITGESGEQILNLTLPQGEQGKQGIQGEKGDVGPPNKLSIGSVTKGEAAAAILTGEVGNQILNLTLPMGKQGIKGEPGPPTKLSIGTIAKGEEASAELIGVAGNQILNLTLPKGDKGKDGVIQEITAGYFALSINEEGHLILTYADGDTPPDLKINEEGHLILTL